MLKCGERPLKEVMNYKGIFILISMLLLTSCSGEEKSMAPSINNDPIVVEMAETEPTASEVIEVAEPESTASEVAEGEETEPASSEVVEVAESESTANEVEEEESEPSSSEVAEEESEPTGERTEDASEAETQEAGGFSQSEITDDIKARINGLSYKSNCTVPYEDLRYLKVLYVDFNGETRSGEIVCNKAIAGDLLEIFKELYDQKYEIDKIRLVDEYGADDDLSCADDNTSCFNFRTVEGSKNLSKHALGLAIDINPFYNPYVTYPGGVERISPPGSEPFADRSQDFPHKIDKNDAAYKAFKARGFTWGGDWKTLKDYQHFQKS